MSAIVVEYVTDRVKTRGLVTSVDLLVLEEEVSKGLVDDNKFNITLMAFYGAL